MPRRKNRKMGKIQKAGKIEKSKCKAKQSGSHVIKGFFAYHQDKVKNKIKNWMLRSF